MDYKANALPLHHGGPVILEIQMRLQKKFRPIVAAAPRALKPDDDETANYLVMLDWSKPTYNQSIFNGPRLSPLWPSFKL